MLFRSRWKWRCGGKEREEDGRAGGRTRARAGSVGVSPLGGSQNTLSSTKAVESMFFRPHLPNSLHLRLVGRGVVRYLTGQNGTCVDGSAPSSPLSLSFLNLSTFGPSQTVALSLLLLTKSFLFFRLLTAPPSLSFFLSGFSEDSLEATETQQRFGDILTFRMMLLTGFRGCTCVCVHSAVWSVVCMSVGKQLFLELVC